MYVPLTLAKRNLETLVELALRGKEIIICRRGKPMVRLEPIPTKLEYKLVRRIPGRSRGKAPDSMGSLKLRK
jgi:antitoxin (DNA-binding transcriptional repressor) of toxin-antitoxin stability system